MDMARRKDVFQSKVLQRLYPAAPKLEKEPSPPRITEGLAKKVSVKRKISSAGTITGNEGTTQSAVNPGRRVYTVLPPPADYKHTHTEESIDPPTLESVNSDKDPAEQSAPESSEEIEQDQEEEHKRRRRRKKRKPTLHPECDKGGAAQVTESSTELSETPANEGGERISKNKKRKLKKKRHKEKLLSMGLMPRATALEFTYKKDGEEGGDSERRAAEVSDFLRTTMKLYMSDSSFHVDNPRLLSGTIDDLVSSIASGSKPISLLKQLYSLKALVQRKEMDKLQKALQELNSMSLLSADETTAVVSLFQYWITDILPMHDDKEAELSTTHA